MPLKQKIPSLPRNLASSTFGKLLIVFSTKVNLLYLLYLMTWEYCLYLIKQNYLLKFFRWGTHLHMSLFSSVRPSVRLPVCHAPYLRNRTSSNHNFWYTCVKFQFFKILIFLGVRWGGKGAGGLKGQKIAQNEKWQLHMSRAISQGQYSIRSWFLVLLCKMMTSPGVFFIFLTFSFFGLLGR